MLFAARKLLLMFIVLFFTISLSCYVAWLLGYQGLLLNGNFEFSYAISIVICAILFLSQFYLTSSIILDKYNIDILKITALYSLIYVVSELIIGKGSITSTILPFLFILGCSIYYKNFKGSLLRLIGFIAIIGSYQTIVIPIKTNLFAVGYNDLSMYQGIIFSIDYFLLLLVLYLIGGELYALDREFVIFPKNVENPENDYEDSLAINSFKILPLWKKAKALALLLFFQGFQWLITLFACSLGNKFLEGLAITLSFMFFGFVIKRRWHSNSVIICTLLSTTLFYICAKASPNFEYSQFIPAIIGFIVTYALYRLSLYVDEYERLKEYFAKLNSFKLEKYCSYEKMLKIAQSKGLTKREIELIEYKYCKAVSWAHMEAKFSPWSLSSIKKYLKLAEAKFYA